MEKNSVWYLAGIGLIGVVVGIIFVGILTSVVHWAGTPKFCGEFCPSMDATYIAYQKGDHFRTASGATAGCSDCHLKNHSNEHVGPIDYVEMLMYKAKAGSISLFGQIQGSLSTPEKQIEKRPEMAAAVLESMRADNFEACRGCHDVQRMYNPGKPLVAAIHKGMGPETKVDCISCHPTAGHNYTGEILPVAQAK